MPNASSFVEGVEEASLAYEYFTVNGSLDFYNHAAASFLPLFSLPLEQRGGWLDTMSKADLYFRFESLFSI